MNPQPETVGANQDLDKLYAELGVIEEREIHAIECGRLDLLAAIREEQLPLKRRINELEGCTIYPEGAVTD